MNKHKGKKWRAARMTFHLQSWRTRYYWLNKQLVEPIPRWMWETWFGFIPSPSKSVLLVWRGRYKKGTTWSIFTRTQKLSLRNLQDPGPFGEKSVMDWYICDWFRITDKNDQGKTNLNLKKTKKQAAIGISSTATATAPLSNWLAFSIFDQRLNIS